MEEAADFVLASLQGSTYCKGRHFMVAAACAAFLIILLVGMLSSEPIES